MSQSDSRDLESRIRRFLRSQPGATDLDEVPHLKSSPRADLLLREGFIVCELKSIREDMTTKIPSILEKHGVNPDPGRHQLPKLLKGHPHHKAVEKEVWLALGTSIETHLRKANQQVRQEIGRLKKPVTGLVVLINDTVADMHPEFLMRCLEEKVNKMRAGKPRFCYVNLVWVISEVFPPEMNGIAAFLGFSPNSLVKVSTADFRYIEKLNEEWQKSQGYARTTGG